MRIYSQTRWNHARCSSLQLMVDVDGKQEWRECAFATGVRLPTGYFFGASSATGDLSGMKSVKPHEHAWPLTLFKESLYHLVDLTPTFSCKTLFSNTAGGKTQNSKALRISARPI